jgi:hypothetical protein
LVKQRGMHIILAMHTPSDMYPSLLHGRQLYHGARLLPGIRDRGIKGQSGFIKIIESDFSLVFLFLSGFKFPLTPGTCCRVSETFSRLSHTLPSKPGSLGETFEGRNTEALCRFLGEPLPNLCERTGFFLTRLDGELLFFRRQLWGSAAAGFIMETRRPIVCPCPDPCRDGVAINLRDRGDCIDRHPLGTA